MAQFISLIDELNIVKKNLNNPIDCCSTYALVNHDGTVLQTDGLRFTFGFDVGFADVAVKGLGGRTSRTK